VQSFPSTREALELSIEKADPLMGRSYIRFVRERGIKYTVRFSAEV
jgi:hypothetical protein